MIKILFKKMSIYRLHRNDELDHKKGRPTILLKYKNNNSLVWSGTTKIDKFTVEKPIIVEINDKKTYFYSTGIEKVKTKDLIGTWTNFKTDKPYILSDEIEKKLITKFSELTNQKDPYKKNALLELENEMLKKENKKLTAELQLLKQEIENQKIEEIIIKDEKLEDEYELE